MKIEFNNEMCRQNEAETIFFNMISENQLSEAGQWKRLRKYGV